jgi:hypothetical protein
LLLPGGALEKFMALGRDVVDAIIREHSYRPIAGDVLLVGQQTVNISRGELLELLREHGIDDAPGGRTIADMPLAGDSSAEVDRGVSAAAFFQVLEAEARTIRRCRENANIIHDPRIEYISFGSGRKMHFVHVRGTGHP